MHMQSNAPAPATAGAHPHPIPMPPREGHLARWLPGCVGHPLAWEMVHIVRPALYCAMLSRHGRRAWIPWAASLAMDIFAGAAAATLLEPVFNDCKDAVCCNTVPKEASISN